jgi:hypothetical protein
MLPEGKMSTCSYCGKNLSENSLLQDGNNKFCDNFCRRSFDVNGGRPKTGSGINQPAAKTRKSLNKSAATVAAVVSAVVAIVVAQLTTGFMQKDFSKLSEYKSPDHSFIVMLPGNVVEQEQTINTPLGPIKMCMYSAKSKHQEFTVAYSDYPDSFINATDPTVLLDGSRDGAVRNIQGQLLSETLIKLQGHPGRELSIEGPQKIILKSRIYLVKRRLFQVMAISKPGHAFDKKIEDVFDSFTINDSTKTGI